MKRWLLENFLPMWAKETVLRDNRQLRRELRALQQENQVLRAYAKGMEKGMRRTGRAYGSRAGAMKSPREEQRKMEVKYEHL